MIELIRSWLVGITCAAAIVALCESLAPAGTVRKIGRLTGGLVLLLAIVQPVMKLNMDDFAGILTSYRVDAEVAAMDMGLENARLMKGIIEEETAAYILDKAEALGIDCRVDVTAAMGEEEGDYPIPHKVTVVGELTQDQRRELTRRIEADLAIPAERQAYEREEVE